MGVLTKYLLEKPITTYVIEIDTESVDYLNAHYPKLQGKIISKDFLKYNINEVFEGKPFAITGNFPYNISSQIVFKCLELRDQVPEFTGMFQKEVAERICEKKAVKPMASYRFWYRLFMRPSICLRYTNMYLIRHQRLNRVCCVCVEANFTLPCSEKLFFRW